MWKTRFLEPVFLVDYIQQFFAFGQALAIGDQQVAPAIFKVGAGRRDVWGHQEIGRGPQRMAIG